jgi:uncharacterized protein YbjT (DUF2867 family)
LKAIVIGATGATGKDLVQELLQDQEIEKVRVLVRKNIFPNHPKLEIFTINFEHKNSWKNLVEGDIAFSCLGTTLKNAGSKINQKNIDFQIPLSFAEEAKTNGVEHFILLSAFGANKDSKMFYPKIKGELEEAIIELNFEKLSILQPGILERENSDRIGEKIAIMLLKNLNKIGLFLKQKPLPTSILAKAMVEISKRKTTGTNFFQLQEIPALVHKN